MNFGMARILKKVINFETLY